jgi:hypothetical protein
MEQTDWLKQIAAKTEEADYMPSESVWLGIEKDLAAPKKVGIVGKKRLPYYLPYAAVILFLILPFIWILLSKYNNTPVDNLSEKIAEATEKHSPSTPETSKIETQETHSKVKFHHQAKVQKAGFEKSKDVSELGQNSEKVKQYSVVIAEIPSKITFLPLDMNFPESMIPIDENFQVVKADLPQERHITNFESISSFFLVKVLGQKDAQVRLEKVKKSETKNRWQLDLHTSFVSVHSRLPLITP